MNTDIYKLSEFINEIQKKHIPVQEDTLYMGMFGYMNEVYSNMMQNSAIAAAEWGNESFAIRSKYEKNILTNAVMYGVKDLNAVPAKMSVMIGLIEKELISNMVNNTFTLYKDCKIMIEEFEYHLDYDIIITRTKLPNGNYTYAARYDIGINNPVSDVTNPYLPPVYFLNIENNNFLFINCTIRQVEESKIYKKIISNNILENKTFDFEFDSQLVTFSVKVTENGEEIYLLPIFEGMPLNNNQKYCFYNYIDGNTIRIKFDRKSYTPKLNCDIEVGLVTTKGSDANFMYRDDIMLTLKSEKIDYRNLSILIKPITDSVYGVDRKSIDQLREIIPKQILARGTIITNKDLENFFNTIDNNKLYFYKKRDNQIERLYYAYMIFKDSKNNIIPTNTLNLSIKESEFTNNYDDRYSFGMEKLIEYKDDDKSCIINKDSLKITDIVEKEKTDFLYGSPFTCVINKNPLCVSYYLNNINNNYYLKFSYINANSEIQFICTSMIIRRISLEDEDYIIKMEISQNMIGNKGLVKVDEDGNIIECNIKPMLYIDNVEEKYYVEGKIIGFNKSRYIYTVEYRLKTNCIIDQDNRIRINDLILSGNKSNSLTYSYLKQSVQMSFYIFAKFDQEYGRYNSDPLFPDMDGYTLCNIYDTQQKVDLFYNYSNIINSIVEIKDLYNLNNVFYHNTEEVLVESNIVPINLNFNKLKDSLLVFKDNKLLNDYTISEDNKNIINTGAKWIFNESIKQKFDFIIFANNTIVNSKKILTINSNSIKFDFDYDVSEDSLLVFKNNLLLRDYEYNIHTNEIINPVDEWVGSSKNPIIFNLIKFKDTVVKSYQIKLESEETKFYIGDLNYNKNKDRILIFKDRKLLTNYKYNDKTLFIEKSDNDHWNGHLIPVIFDIIIIKDSLTKSLNDLNNLGDIDENLLEFSQYDFFIKNIPLVRYSYLNDVKRFEYLIEYLQYRKIYIDTALEILENSFSIDLKFFNTYGRSRTFKIGHKNEILDKVNLTLNFQMKLKPEADNYCKDYIIQEIKNYIENINNNITSMHMTNLTTDLNNKFKSDIEYIEFLGINNYNALYQYVEKEIIDDVEMVPEFLNINLSDNENPDINIILV